MEKFTTLPVVARELLAEIALTFADLNPVYGWFPTRLKEKHIQKDC
jgi:hypothetical protein